MRQHYRKKLNNLLGAASDEDFIQLLWAAHSLQSKYSDAGRNHIDPQTIPDGAISTDMVSKFFIQKWEIETLANELMTTPKINTTKNGITRNLRPDSFQSIIQCANWLRKLENVEYSIGRKDESIFVEMARLASRQFDWQRGYVNIPQFYRNAFVYGQGECAAYFEQTNGISINRFSLLGFMFFVAFTEFPVIEYSESWENLGVDKNEFEKVLALLSQSFASASRVASRQRTGIIQTAYRPSILRQTPCLRFGPAGQKIRSPLPELILERITSGIFYDLVEGDGSVRNEYGNRFEEYCFDCLETNLPALSWSREVYYGKTSNRYATPDIICSESGEIRVVLECKSSRMSQNAMFGKDPLAARGFDDLVKAVFQLWRYFSHCRRRICDYQVAETAIGVVLTLDNWLVLAETLRESVIRRAGEMAHERDPEILQVDRKPVVFIAVNELERTLGAATEETFIESLVASVSEKYVGWRIDSIHKDILGERKPQGKDYPFAVELGKLLPWWTDLAKNKLAI